MNNLSQGTETICSTLGTSTSSPVPSPRTDTRQYTAFHDTKGDWHDMTCSPSNCVINTISPNTSFSPHQQQSEQPPSIRYIPQFEYELHPNLSPLLTTTSPYNYQNPNMTFYNPYLTKSCKRALNTSSSSSLCSRLSPLTKRPKQDLSTYSGSTNQSQQQLHLDKTCLAAEDDERSECSNNNQICQNCPDSLPVVAVCRTCPDQPALCQLCLDAHQRVKLTREHLVLSMGEQNTDKCWRSVPAILLSIVELLEVDLDDSIAATAAELMHTWGIHLDTLSEKEIAQDQINSGKVVEENLIPLFLQGDIAVKVRSVAIMQMLVDLKVVNVTSSFANDNCIEGFEEMINAEDSEVVEAALNCLQCLVKGIAVLGAKFSLIKLHSKLVKQLRRLKLFEAGYTTCVQFKAGKLIREMEKCLME